MPAPSGEVIRPYDKRDREAVRALCRRTGQKGNPTETFFEDEEIAPLLLADYYLDYEPELCLVAEVEGRVVGYCLGCRDTRRQLCICAIRIYPRVVFRVFWKLVTFQYRRRVTYQTLWWIIGRSWREAHVPPLDRYAAHAHFNVERSHRSSRLGRRLSLAWRGCAWEYGVRSMHIIVREAKGDDSLSAFFCSERGYRIIAVKPFTLWQKITGKEWQTKLLVCDLLPPREGKSCAFTEA
jgi:GNAT superfamily N-acetyltransferase